MPDTDDPTETETVQFTMPVGDVVRLTAMLSYIEQTRDEPIVQGWAGKQINTIQEQTRIQLGDVAAYQDDIERISDGEFDTTAEQVQGEV